MANEFTDLSKIRHVQPKDPVAAEPTSQPTRAIEIRLQQLEAQLQALSQSTITGNLVIRNVAIKTGELAVEKDDIVYFNPNTGLYEKAVAGVTFVSGLFVTNPSALAVGVCVAVNGVIGDVMIAGYDTWRDDEHKAHMMEPTEDYFPGNAYYLSASNPGKLTRFPPTMRIQILVGTDNHYILDTIYGNPDALDTPLKQPIGMRPVGSLRKNPPNFSQYIVVGFDAMELYSPDDSHLDGAGQPQYGTWRSTVDSAVANYAEFGYLIADAVVNIQPVAPLYIRVQVVVGGVIRVCTAATIADLQYDNANAFNKTSLLTALSGNASLTRIYNVLAADGRTSFGTLYFKFTDDDTTMRRDVVFKFPNSFQGWKMINAPISPIATAILDGDTIAAIKVLESGVGYDTAPDVFIDDTSPHDDSNRAAAIAILDQNGSIVAVNVTTPGSDYVAPTITFKNRLKTLNVLNGGSGATATADNTGDDSGVNSDTVAVVDRGSGYLTPPSITFTDPTGAGMGASGVAIIRNGEVIAIEVTDGGRDYGSVDVLIQPSANFGYRKTTVALYDITIGGGILTAVAPHAGAAGANHPIGCRLRVDGDGTGATVEPVLGLDGEIVSVNITNAGSAYSVATITTLDFIDPKLVLLGGNPTSPSDGTLVMASMGVDRIDIISSGVGYSDGDVLAFSVPEDLSGDVPVATVRADIQGRIIGINLSHRGSGYDRRPTLTFPGSLGTGAILDIVLGASIVSATVTEPGDGYDSPPAAYAGCPVTNVEIEFGGSLYTVIPGVSFRPPDLVGGITATGVAVMGGRISEVFIIDAGTGYTEPENWEITITGGGGSDAILKPIISGGELVSVEIVNTGHDFTSIPTLALVQLVATPGSGAALQCNIEAVGSVVGVDITNQGSGYISPPPITINPPTDDSGIQARATCKLVGEGAMLTADISGNGGLRFPQASSFTQGNAMQIYDFGDDLNDSPEAPMTKPLVAVFYYNIKADPGLKSKYPSIPAEKSMFILNGTEMLVSAYNEVTAMGFEIDPDVILCRKSPFWTTFDVNACPWDLEFQNYVIDLDTGGTDHIIPTTGPFGFEASWFRFWEHVFIYEVNRNKGWLHINRGSRFYQTGRVSALGVLSPLRLIDVTTGSEAKNDGTPITGQLVLTLDSQATFLVPGVGVQIDLASANNLVPIYKNLIGRPVMISSVILSVLYQLNTDPAVVPTVVDNARITVGTQVGNYRDIIGTVDPSLITQSGAETKLYAVNQVKELFPDNRDSAPLILPGQEVFMRVDTAASTNLKIQLALIKVRGYVF